MRWAVILLLPALATLSAAQVPASPPSVRFVLREASGAPLPRTECFLVAHLPGQAPRSSSQWTDDEGERDWPLDDEELALLARGARFELVVPLPIGSETRCAYDPRRRQRAELRLPPSGKLDLVLCDEHGQPLEAGVAFHLRSGEHERGTGEPLQSPERGFLVEAQHGRVRTPPVALGQRFRIAISLYDASRPESEHLCEGPREAEQILACRLHAAPRLPRLDLKLCDPSGEAIADTACEYRFEGASIGVPRSPARTDPRGELRILLASADSPRGKAAPPARGGARLELWAPPMNPRWQARLELAPERIARGGDLGAIRAQEIEVGVRGVVVDHADRPLPERAVALAEEPAERATYASWQRLRTTTDAEGRFELRVPSEIARVRLRVVRAYEDASTMSDVQLELRDLEPRLPRHLELRLALRARGEIAGRILLDDPRHARELEVLIEDARGEMQRKQLLASSGLPPGRFAFGDLEAGGTYAVRIGLPRKLVTPQAGGVAFRLEHFGRAGLCELRALEGLALPPNGEPCADPRLREIDLRGALVIRELTVLDAAGRPLAREAIHVAQRTPDGALRSIAVETDAMGRARWLGPAGELELWLGKLGHALVALDGRALQQTAELSAESPHTLELLLEDPPPVLPEHTRLTLHLRCYEVPELWVAGGGADISDHEVEVRGGLARFALSYPGTYHVHWQLESERGGIDQILWQDFHTPLSVSVRDQPGLQRQTLRWPREEVAEALRRDGRGR